jgi:hypothetical protein
MLFTGGILRANGNRRAENGNRRAQAQQRGGEPLQQ